MGSAEPACNRREMSGFRKGLLSGIGLDPGQARAPVLARAFRARLKPANANAERGNPIRTRST